MEATLLDAYRTLGLERQPEHGLAYMSLRRAIRHTIESGAAASGQALPSERELARLLQLSRVTVRKAITGLVSDGLLVQRQGAGTFVADRIVKSFSRLSSFSEDLRARGLKPRSQFLDRGTGTVTPEEAMALNLSPGAGVVRLHRLRFAGDEPLAIERSVIPRALLPDPALIEHSLYEAFDRLGCRPSRALQRLRAVAFDAAQSRLLGVPVGSPGLLIERRGFLEDGRVVEFTCSHYRGDIYDFVAELHND
ncbi:MAG: GntR family transcriptional regulator [Nevskia sp.]|nr:GntR family transcriptional regulator [Nevskia sp.]